MHSLFVSGEFKNTRHAVKHFFLAWKKIKTLYNMHYIIERNTYFTILEDEIQNVLVLKVGVEFINAAPHGLKFGMAFKMASQLGYLIPSWTLVLCFSWRGNLFAPVINTCLASMRFQAEQIWRMCNRSMAIAHLAA